jgi:hypothetical protein
MISDLYIGLPCAEVWVCVVAHWLYSWRVLRAQCRPNGIEEEAAGADHTYLFRSAKAISIDGRLRGQTSGRAARLGE